MQQPMSTSGNPEDHSGNDTTPVETTPKKRGNPNWGKGMASPNPHGRKVGSKNPMTQLQNELIEKFSRDMRKDFDGIIKAVINQAKSGDMTAAKLLLDRAIPARKAVEHYGEMAGMGGITIIISGTEDADISGHRTGQNAVINGEFEALEDEDE